MEIVRLPEVTELNPKFAGNLSSNDTVGFVPMAAVSESTRRIEHEEERTYGNVAKGFTPFRNGDVIVAKITPCFENGKMALVQLKHEFGFGSTEFHVIRPNHSRIDARFLFHFLAQERLRREGQSRMTGSAGQRRVPKSFYEQLEIPLPSLPEQQRIAAILDAADGLRARRRAALGKLDALLQSVFLEMFGDPVGNEKGWEEVNVGDIANVKGGKRLPKGDTYSPIPTPYRYIRIADIINGHIDVQRLQYLRKDTYKQISRYIVNEGDVIISIAGTLGLTVPVDSTLNGVNLTENAAKLVPKKAAQYTAGYLAYALQTPYCQNQIGALTGQVTIGKLALFRIEKISLLLPPIELQHRFEEVKKQIVKRQEQLSRSEKGLERLFVSLQQHAFRGELNSAERE